MIRKLGLLLVAGAAAIGLARPAVAATVIDPVGDYLPTYRGPQQPDLDVTEFSVFFNPSLSTFLLQTTMAGPIDTSIGGFYVIGANTGTGPNNFASLGLSGVTFNQAIVVQKNGTGTVGVNALPAGSVTIDGRVLNVTVPLSLLPTTGFAPINYGFNMWPRTNAPGITGNPAISDFAPDNGILAVSAPVPEPASWTLMILGLGVVGWSLRRRGQPTLRTV